ncbi:uncharacterized protein LOC107408927 isoform X6 [Ziziphus jujuba]|uniref:Uncharacterized protein LOC107408927 isoform X6 n=1 Tax=Ziziphus jujuba TaxID=326968 RepID=A0ABM3IME8_ZIZJJ|nr:uncharacterized protein LOC107408927 isoform X6 [Ziziphus jujuba]
MLGDGGETPSRFELLSMVKKNSSLLEKTLLDKQDDTDIEMDESFWHGVLDLYFIRGKESRRRQDDDLVFFVRKLNSQGDDSGDDKEGFPPYFVRSHQALLNHQVARETPLSPIYKVVKTVYASPSRVNFQLDSKKEVETTPAYPDICFAIDDFDSTFDAVVLTETDHCYCVLLNAHGGAAFPSENEQHNCSTSEISPMRIESNTGKTQNTKLTLFSGFVSYQMVRDAYDAGKSRFGSLLSLGNSPGKTDRLYMKGPGGRGEVEVAVSGVADQSHQDSGPFSPVISKKGFGIGSIVRKAAAVASEAAKQAYAAAASSTSFDEEIVPLKCSLMSISLPWEQIAYDLLFKGSPPVNL